jgi:hypothetical protein
MIAKSAMNYRIAALDFTKGALVLIMVFYHWLNYFIGNSFDYRYLRFLTPSFIFVTGFLISHVYLARYSAADSSMWKRLFTRGAKLLVIFIFLNLARAVVLSTFSNSGAMAEQLNVRNLWALYVIGPTTTSKIVSFYILIPISYVLILSAVLLSLYRYYKYTFHAVCVLFVMGILALGINGFHNPNLELMTIGLLGSVIGFIPSQKINNLIRHPYLFAFLYSCYLVAIAVWNVPFVLLAVGVCLTLWGIYWLGLNDAAPSKGRMHIILLGKHSLFGYVAQIAILQLLSACLRHLNLGSGVMVISFVAAFALTMVTVEVMERAKRKSILVDRLYKVAFA